MRIVLAGGGTGGHISPLAALATRLAQEKGVELLWIGSRAGPEDKEAAALRVPYQGITTGKLRRYWDFANVLDLFRIPLGIIEAYLILLRFDPAVVFGKGGYVSVPVLVAAWLTGKQIIIHESDTVPGLANRVMGRFAHRILLAFGSSRKHFPHRPPAVFAVTGIPLRGELARGDKEWGYAFFHLDHERPVLLVVGGSQGASRLNQIVIGALDELLALTQVIHVAGEREFLRLEHFAAVYKDHGYRLFATLGKELALAYQVADLVISRGGATSLAELALVGKPALVIPLPSAAGGHQEENARFYKVHRACEVLREDELSGPKFLTIVKSLLADRERLKTLSDSIKQLAHPEATELAVKEILKLAHHHA